MGNVNIKLNEAGKDHASKGQRRNSLEEEHTVQSKETVRQVKSVPTVLHVLTDADATWLPQR